MKSAELRLYVYEMYQDDPKKCTSAKLRRLHLAKPVFRRHLIPKAAVVLNPKSKEVLTPSDRTQAEAGGLVAIDCSWKRAEDVFSKRFRGVNRRLPLLVASNPVNYGHIATLSTVEALAAALFILGFPAQAEKILSVFKWGPNFLTLNEERLEGYRRAQTEEDVMKLEAGALR